MPLEATPFSGVPLASAVCRFYVSIDLHMVLDLQLFRPRAFERTAGIVAVLGQLSVWSSWDLFLISIVENGATRRLGGAGTKNAKPGPTIAPTGRSRCDAERHNGCAARDEEENDSTWC